MRRRRWQPQGRSAAESFERGPLLLAL